jgi:uncharacterized membrane protein
MANTKKTEPVKKSNKGVFIGVGVAIVLIAVLFIVKNITGSGSSSGASADATSQGGDITITKSDVTETAKFIPYKAENTKMEVIALKAPDGSIRTAFNTCQVCYDSGRGYYVQEGDQLVCQNCGNRFEASQVEEIKGGCNPVPILTENKTDDGTTITIPKDFLEPNKALFGNWKK